SPPLFSQSVRLSGNPNIQTPPQGPTGGPNPGDVMNLGDILPKSSFPGTQNHGVAQLTPAVQPAGIGEVGGVDPDLMRLLAAAGFLSALSGLGGGGGGPGKPNGDQIEQAVADYLSKGKGDGADDAAGQAWRETWSKMTNVP